MAKDTMPAYGRKLGRYGVVLPVILILLGLLIGFAGLALVSNQLGNTDIYGLPIVSLGGFLLGTGICHLFAPLKRASLLGLAAGPFALVLLFVAYWIGLLATAAFR